MKETQKIEKKEIPEAVQRFLTDCSAVSTDAGEKLAALGYLMEGRHDFNPSHAEMRGIGLLLRDLGASQNRLARQLGEAEVGKIAPSSEVWPDHGANPDSD